MKIIKLANVFYNLIKKASKPSLQLLVDRAFDHYGLYPPDLKGIYDDPDKPTKTYAAKIDEGFMLIAIDEDPPRFFVKGEESSLEEIIERYKKSDAYKKSYPDKKWGIDSLIEDDENDKGEKKEEENDDPDLITDDSQITWPYTEEDWAHACEVEKMSEDFLKRHADKINWYNVSAYQDLSEDFIMEFFDNFDDKDWFNIFKFQHLSENFLLEFKKRFNIEPKLLNLKALWSLLPKYQKHISQSFFDKHKP